MSTLSFKAIAQTTLPKEFQRRSIITLRNELDKATLAQQTVCPAANEALVRFVRTEIDNGSLGSPTSLAANVSARIVPGNGTANPSCIAVSGEMPPSQQVCYEVPRIRGPFQVYNERICNTIAPSFISIAVIYDVTATYSAYLKYNSGSLNGLSRARDLATKLNGSLKESGFSTFSPDQASYVGTRPGFPQRMVIYWYEGDRIAAEAAVATANAWLLQNSVGDPVFKVQSQVGTTPGGPPGALSIELWMPD